METKKELKDILEEIEQELDRHINTQLKIMDGLEEDVYRYGYGKSLEAYQQGKLFVKDIICNHLNDGWILVEERLPENEHSVLMCGNPGWIDVGWFVRGVWRTGFSAAEITNEVVAWRPLPDPYRPEREANRDEK